ncbi:GNAT family N-acetyltransferase [Chromobacterium paludis]|uniref:GNAT family N-acetyltransferase n=1 Tax=Chromobacterium paludis TaxID=2605945 RepID=A0A5C1DEF9_9NEIS|nr:GNAT family N-acetyltransferase [Chromobacterium paludis]QEL55155.1 GNAT family N-acetyltransferase [Chromobacterium paludis]
MNIASLEGLQAADLHPCFLAAFSDYLVPAQPALEPFAAMLNRRGWVPELSAGAWLDGALIGFWLTATPWIDGRQEGYCIAAGVAPEGRRRHALTEMARHVTARLAERGILQQRLEVIDGNLRARQAYATLGFSSLRRLDCYQIQQPIAARQVWAVTAHAEHGAAAWPDAQPAYPPAVPNRRESLRRAEPALRWLTVERDSALLGSFLLSRDGEAVELHVAPEYRRRGIAGCLLREGQKLTPGGRLSFNNVDSRDLPLIQLLLKHQASYRLSQWEMAKPAAQTAQ